MLHFQALSAEQVVPEKKNAVHFNRVPTHPGKPGKQLTNFPVMENTWKMREKVKCPEKSYVVLENDFNILLFSLS